MRIVNGRYLVDGAETIIHLSDMNKQAYKKRFKGKLYCPTKGCPALLSYSGGKKAHFRTWRRRQHSDGCIYNINRAITDIGQSALEDKTFTISGHRKQNALRAAARLFPTYKTEGDAAKNRSSPRNIPSRRKNENKKRSIQMTLYDGDFLEEDAFVKGKAIRKRFVDEIKQRDIGQVRLVLGFIRQALPVGEVAELSVEHNGAGLKVIFPEEFVKERLNSSYLNKFTAIARALEAGQSLTFAGVGDIMVNDNGHWELVIYSGADFKINHMDLTVFAKSLLEGN